MRLFPEDDDDDVDVDDQGEEEEEPTRCRRVVAGNGKCSRKFRGMDNRIRFLESNEGKRELLWPVNEVDKSSLFGIIGHQLNTPVLVPLR